MKEKFVRDLMVPLEEYATVSENASLYEAVIVLEKAQEDYLKVRKKSIYPHRAILVLNHQELISSRNMATMATSGFSSDFLRNMFQPYGLFAKPLAFLCKKAARVKVREIMYTPDQGEFVKDDDTLDIAVHQFIMGRHHSLLVTDEKDAIVGILRLVDVFTEIATAIKACEI